ncbi:hypothetical protein [Agrobacterium rosae]|uniref:Uncharacterized protein n=1 Tax=Agrobacterium rosae TaxID=1972867 RepID=A0AAW9F803_9HYPH|nr:hypothetical protein [Agrobacterium rosae]MDX8301459.1 hypothetical protein [Agrobacterium rosae]
MTAKPLYLSDLISDLQRKLNSVVVQHGRISLDPVQSATFVASIGKLADHARNLENQWSQAEWNRRALVERAQLLSEMNTISAEVLQLMKPEVEDDEKVVVQFRPRPRPAPGPSVPPGGDAA